MTSAGENRTIPMRGLLMIGVWAIALNPATQAADTVEIGAKDFVRRTVYHSPQTPGFTSWAGLWRMPDKSVMLCFTQATGPLTGWRPRAPKAVRERLSWPPPGREGYDMTGLVLENVHLRSTDGGKTWRKVSADPFNSCMNGCTGEGETSLADGTVLRAVWGQYLPYWDVPQTGYLQRSGDGTLTWGPPEPLSTDQKLQTWPKRVRVLADGRIVITGAAARRDREDWTRNALASKLRPCLWVSLDKSGRKWSQPIETMPEDSDCAGEEFDVAELGNGDLLAVYRVAVKGKRIEERRQSLLVKRADTWAPTPVRQTPFPHSGHPELLATREGVVLHIATNGTWWTADRGEHWTRLAVRGSAYYPRSVQLDDGTILVAGHLGSDDPYGGVDQAIVLDSYRLDGVPTRHE